jgi:predicted acetyltransferase
LEVPRAAGFRQPTPGRVRVLTPDEVEPLLGDLFARVQSRHAGTIARTPISWQAMLGRIAPAEAFKKRWFAAHFDDAGVIDGVVVYDHKDVWQDWMPAAEVHIDDFLAATDEAEEALWQYCASIDFVTSIEFETSPELPMAAWLTNPRAARTRSTWDGMWARILDTPAALSARTYEVPGTVVLQVNDELAGGRFALTVDESGAATCEPTTAEPDLVLGAGELATLWFGLAHGTGSLDAMRRLGRVQVDPAKIGWLSAFFSTTWRRQGITHF